MIVFSRDLPRQFNQPLPVMMARLTPPSHHKPEAHRDKSIQRLNNAWPLSANDIRKLADAVAAWHLCSPLGICLRRSLLRYHFLREADTPVEIVFGARLKEPRERGGLGGHAWLTLDGRPYYENPADYEGFVVMYTYPKDEEATRGSFGGQET